MLKWSLTVYRPLILTIVETCKRLGVSAYRIIRQACQQALTKKPVTVRLPIPPPQVLNPVTGFLAAYGELFREQLPPRLVQENAS
ncbi:MAG: hypothetical protein QJT81_08515 [Candidatus Thiothrix putei]|uniref:Uncharacterized protein n=1 Tax=Candidatus Thiothrix putei TaxID=3080811 RepID=A0AA95HK78_9GAMM|nr:MAG: hypothetical protein QJT81_08515 [Candidatus Thiothrix putei]